MTVVVLVCGALRARASPPRSACRSSRNTSWRRRSLAGTLGSTWDSSTPPGAMAMVGMGPFLIREYQPGSTHRCSIETHAIGARRKTDRRFRISTGWSCRSYPTRTPSCGTFRSGEVDLGWAELRSEDYVPVRRLEEQGRVRLIELGVDAGADAFWFCLAPEVKQADPRFAFVQRAGVPSGDLARGRSGGVRGDRVPGRGRAGVGPGHAGQQRVVLAESPRYAPSDDRARELLKGIGLEDRNGNGVVEDVERHRSTVHRA